MSNLLKKTSNLLIYHERPERIAHSRSFVLSNLSESLTVAHLIWAKERWANEQIPNPIWHYTDTIRAFSYILKNMPKSSNKDRTALLFSLLKRGKHKAFCTCLFEKDGDKTNSAVGLQSQKWKKRSLKCSLSLIGKVFSPREMCECIFGVQYRYKFWKRSIKFPQKYLQVCFLNFVAKKSFKIFYGENNTFILTNVNKSKWFFK